MLAPPRDRYAVAMLSSRVSDYSSAAVSFSPRADAAPAARWPVSILGVPLDVVTMDEALARIAAMVESGRPHYVVTPNVDFLVQARNNPELHRILCEADLVLCDGQPLVWASRWLGNPLPERVAGADLTPRLLEQAAQKGHRIYLLGATPESNDEACRRLLERYPDLQLVGHYAPPFSPLEQMDHEATICRIRATEPDILLISFGCPKQEQWIARNYRALGVPVCLGLGATIDFLAGRVRRAPAWMQRSGLEWSYRLLQEPRRLFRRYWTDLRYFGLALLGQWWSLHWKAPAAARGAFRVISTSERWEHVQVSGALDRLALERATEICRRLGEDGSRDCRLELSGVDSLDSTGVAALTVWQRKLRRAGRRLVLFRPNGHVRRLLRQAGLLHLETSDGVGAGRA